MFLPQLPYCFAGASTANLVRLVWLNSVRRDVYELQYGAIILPHP